MLPLRRQLPVYSPVRFASLFDGALGALGVGDPRRLLRTCLAEHFGTIDLLLVDSGTSALRLAIECALEARGGDTVALPAYCCYDVATAAVGAGARIRLYDVNPATLGPDWDSLADALSAGVDAVVAVHLYGIPVDMARIAGMATSSGAIVIEDAAQGIGGEIGGRPLGSVGSLGILSFGRGKGLTGGGGGALLANDEIGRAVYGDIRDRVDAGHSGWGGLVRLAVQWLFGRPSLYGIPASLPWLGLGETYYQEPWVPRAIARGHAAALLSNWNVSFAEAEVRGGKAGELSMLMGDGEPTAVRTGTPKAQGSLLRLPILLEAAVRSSDVMKTLTRIGVVAGYPAPLDSIADVRRCLTGAATHAGATILARDLMTVPVHSRSDPGELGSVIATVGRIGSKSGHYTWHGTGS